MEATNQGAQQEDVRQLIDKSATRLVERANEGLRSLSDRLKNKDLDEYLGRAGKSSPFLQARNRIRQMLADEREHEKTATVEGNQTRH